LVILKFLVRSFSCLPCLGGFRPVKTYLAVLLARMEVFVALN
jgi:hypothetical protein